MLLGASLAWGRIAVLERKLKEAEAWADVVASEASLWLAEAKAEEEGR